MPTSRSLLLHSRHFHTLVLFFIMLVAAVLISRAGWQPLNTGAAPAPGAVSGQHADAPRAP